MLNLTVYSVLQHGKNGFVTATKLGTTNKIFVAATKIFAAATKRFVDRTKHFVVVTIFFVIPILTNDFVGITKPFFRENSCKVCVYSVNKSTPTKRAFRLYCFRKGLYFLKNSLNLKRYKFFYLFWFILRHHVETSGHGETHRGSSLNRLYRYHNFRSHFAEGKFKYGHM